MNLRNHSWIAFSYMYKLTAHAYGTGLTSLTCTSSMGFQLAGGCAPRPLLRHGTQCLISVIALFYLFCHYPMFNYILVYLSALLTYWGQWKIDVIGQSKWMKWYSIYTTGQHAHSTCSTEWCKSQHVSLCASSPQSW